MKKTYCKPETEILLVYDKDLMYDDIIPSSTITYDDPMGKEDEFDDEDLDEDIQPIFMPYNKYKVFERE